MNKLNLAKKAQMLYEKENLNANEIASKLGISRRTVFNWVKQFNWRKHRIELAQIKKISTEELQRLTSKMIEKISGDMDAKRKLSTDELYTIANLVEQIFKFEKAERKNKLVIEEKPKGITPELIRQINRDILGWDPEATGV